MFVQLNECVCVKNTSLVRVYCIAIMHTDSFYAGVYNRERRIVVIATINLLVR